MNGISRRNFMAGSASAAGMASLAATRTQAQVATEFPESLFPGRNVNRGDTGALPPFAVRVLNKAAFGPARGDVEAFDNLPGGSDFGRLQNWVEQQLNPTAADPEVDARVAQAGSEYATIFASDVVLWTQFVRSDEGSVRSRPFSELDRITYLRGAYSQWQFREVISDFWNNHFHVYSRSDNETRGFMPSYQRALRGDAAGSRLFGNFFELLFNSTRNAAMLYFLDNYRNSWPNPNENYAREVLELHTLGALENYYGAVDPSTVPDNAFGERSGYTEIDVFQFARALTGWGVADGDDGAPDTGAFLFRPNRHYDEHGEEPIQVLDVTINTDQGENDVIQILQYLAEHFGTARFIAGKLCRRLVSDNPPESLVQSTAMEFYNRRGDPDQLREVYRHILLSPEFQNTWAEKSFRPLESMLRTWRAAAIEFIPTVNRPGTTNRNNIASGINDRLEDAGQRPWNIEFPTGYPDFKAFWRATGTLVSSWRLVTYLLSRRDDNSGNMADGFALNLAQQTNDLLPDPNDRTPVQIGNTLALTALGFTPDAGTMVIIIQFIAEQAGVFINQPLDNGAGIDTSNLGNSNYQRIIRAAMALIILLPVGQRR